MSRCWWRSPPACCSAISIPRSARALKPLGDAFIKLVKMIIAPVIFLTVATGIAGMRDLKKVGRVAGKALLYFLVFSTLALIVGLIVANVVQPGAGMHIDPATLDAKAVTAYAAKAHEPDGHRLPDGHHPRHDRRRLRAGRHPAGAVRRDPVRHRPGLVGERGAPVLDFLQALTAPIFRWSRS